MELNEQLIKRIGRRFWRGSPFEERDETKSPFNCLYVTGDVFYALTYLKNDIDDNRETGFLFEYILKERVNIFNARYKKDYQKLEDCCRVHQKDLLPLLPKLKDFDWIDVLLYGRKEKLTNILKDLGYDGFFNIENKQGKIRRRVDYLNDSDLYGFSGLGIFNENALTKYKTYRGWDEISKVDEVKKLIESAKNECAEDALKCFQFVGEETKNELRKKGRNETKDQLVMKIIEESFLPYFLMLPSEIASYIESFDFDEKMKELRKIEKKLRENFRPSFNKYLYLEP